VWGLIQIPLKLATRKHEPEKTHTQKGGGKKDKTRALKKKENISGEYKKPKNSGIGGEGELSQRSTQRMKKSQERSGGPQSYSSPGVKVKRKGVGGSKSLKWLKIIFGKRGPANEAKAFHVAKGRGDLVSGTYDALISEEKELQNYVQN